MLHALRRMVRNSIVYQWVLFLPQPFEVYSYRNLTRGLGPAAYMDPWRRVIGCILRPQSKGIGQLPYSESYMATKPISEVCTLFPPVLHSGDDFWTPQINSEAVNTENRYCCSPYVTNSASSGCPSLNLWISSLKPMFSIATTQYFSVNSLNFLSVWTAATNSLMRRRAACAFGASSH